MCSLCPNLRIAVIFAENTKLFCPQRDSILGPLDIEQKIRWRSFFCLRHGIILVAAAAFTRKSSSQARSPGVPEAAKGSPVLNNLTDLHCTYSTGYVIKSKKVDTYCRSGRVRVNKSDPCPTMTQPGLPCLDRCNEYWRWFRPPLGKKRRVLRSSGPC